MRDDTDASTPVRLLRLLRLACLIIAAVALVGIDLPALITHLDTYTVPGAALLGFAVLAAVLVVEAALIARGRSWGWLRWPAAALVLVVSFVADLVIPSGEAIGYADWSFDAIGWCAIVLLFDQPLWLLVALLTAHFTVTTVHLVSGGRADRTVVLGLTFNIVAITAMQVSLGAATGVLRRIVTIAARADEAAEEARTADAVARRIHKERRDRYADLTKNVRPLLSGLADGTLDPGAEVTRRQCAVAAARMRRVFAESDETVNNLLHELRACADVAERRGVLVELVVHGEDIRAPADIRRALTDVPLQVLATARRWARVTVVGNTGGVAVSVVGDGDLDANGTPVVDTRGVQVTMLNWEDRLWATATWHPTT